MSRGRKGRVCRDERNAKDYLIRIGVIPQREYTDTLEEAWEKAGLSTTQTMFGT
jgi:hypothetical protein